MNVKFGTVRDFGLVGKTVIIDEVHTYDTYTGSILRVLINRLRRLGCTVLILSATLTASQKKDLLGEECPDHLEEEYPLVTCVPSEDEPLQLPSEGLPETKVDILMEDSTRKCIDLALEKAEEGQQVLWIENTVDEAQDIYLSLQTINRSSMTNDGEEPPIEVGLLHSRFTANDRARLEKKWVDLFCGSDQEKRQRKGRILVGTQVLEQSLDIDADLLITRFAPTDMLLQRIGRLWRHQSTVRPPTAERKTVIISPSLDEAKKNISTFGNSRFVYSKYVLLRSLEVWSGISNLSISGDIRNLLESTYRERTEVDGCFVSALKELEEKRTTMRLLADRSTKFFGLSFQTEEEATSTRFNDSTPSFPMVLLSDVKIKDGSLLVESLDGNRIDLYDSSISPIEKSRFLAGCIVKVSKNKEPEFDHSAGILKDYLFGAEDVIENGKVVEKGFVRLGIVKDEFSIRDINNSKISLDKFDISYKRDVGYVAAAKQKN